MVDEIVLYTPAHSLYTDTLITYGLVYPLVRTLEEPEENLEVFGTGMNYIIKIRGFNIDYLAEVITEYIKKKKGRLEKELTVLEGKAETYADGRIGLLTRKDVSFYIDVFGNKDGLKKFLESLKSTQHASKEGRITARGSKLKLPLMPHAGKYLSQDLTVKKRFQEKYYNVCNYCAAFAALGLYCGALTARLKTKLKNWALVITLGFEGKVDGGTLRYALKLIEEEADALANLPRDKKISEIGQELPLILELGLSLDALPLRTLAQAMLCLLADTAIRGLSESDASWKALSVKFDAKKAKSGNLQVRGYDEVLLDPVIDALADLIQKPELPSLREKIRGLLRASRSKGPESGDAITALESLFTFFQTRRLPDLYSFVRSFEVSMRRSKSYRPLSKKLCSALISLGRS